MLEVLNAICRGIADDFTTSPVYIDNIPSGFKRPSFYVELITSQETDYTTDSQRMQMSFQITYFAKQDSFNNVSSLELYSALNVLQGTFYRSLELEDGGFVKIDSLEHQIKDGLLFITLRLDFPAHITNNHLSPEQVYDLMRELQIKYLK